MKPIDQIIAEIRVAATTLPFTRDSFVVLDRGEVLALCDSHDRLTKEVAELKAAAAEALHVIELDHRTKQVMQSTLTDLAAERDRLKAENAELKALNAEANALLQQQSYHTAERDRLKEELAELKDSDVVCDLADALAEVARLQGVIADHQTAIRRMLT